MSKLHLVDDDIQLTTVSVWVVVLPLLLLLLLLNGGKNIYAPVTARGLSEEQTTLQEFPSIRLCVSGVVKEELGGRLSGIVHFWTLRGSW